MSPLTESTRLVLRKSVPGAWAEGGDVVYTIVVSGTTYRVHEFKTVGTSNLVVMNGGSVEYLIVGGGGGGARAGGGGAGGYLPGTANASVQAYPVVVGAGGAGGTTSTRNSGSNMVKSQI